MVKAWLLLLALSISDCKNFLNPGVSKLNPVGCELLAGCVFAGGVPVPFAGAPVPVFTVGVPVFAPAAGVPAPVFAPVVGAPVPVAFSPIK